MLKSVLIASVILATPFSIGAAAAQPVQSIRAAQPTTRFSPAPAASKRAKVRQAQTLQCGTNERPTIACSCEATDSSGACLQESCDTVCLNTSGAGTSEENP